MAAFLTAWQRNESCCWRVLPGSEFTFTPQPRPELTLHIYPEAQRPSLLRQALTWRFLHPDRYHRCFISVEQSGALALLYVLTGSTVPHDAIQCLLSLGDLQH